MAFICTGWTIEAARVAVEVASRATLKNGRLYHNLYHYLIVMRDDKLAIIKEYADTEHVRQTFLDP